MQVSMKTDITKATAKLRGAQRKHIPFAVSKALSDTAWDVAKEEARQMPIKLDRPTPFTRKAFNVIRATKSKLVAVVFIKPVQAAYLKFQIEGGFRGPKNRAIALPADIKLNKYGNIARNQISKLLARPDTFSGKPRGGNRPAGIWQRGHAIKKGKGKKGGSTAVNFAGSSVRSSSIQPLVLWKKKATYTADRFPFFKIGKNKAKAAIGGNLRKAIDAALRSSK